MSLADCLKKIKLKDEVVAQLESDIKNLTKGGLSLQEAEKSALDNLIEQTKKEVELVRKNVKGDFAPVEFKVSDVAQSKEQSGKEYFQRKINRADTPVNTVVLKEASPGNPYSLENISRVVNKLKNTQEVSGYRITRKSFQKIESTVRDFRNDLHGKRLNFDNSQEGIAAHLAVLGNLDEVLKNAEHMQSKEDQKGNSHIDGWEYLFTHANINGQDYLVKSRAKNTKLGKEFYFESIVKMDAALIGNESETGNVVRASFEGTTPSAASKFSVSQFQDIINAHENKYRLWQSSKTNQADTKRGSVSFGQEQTIIRLFKDADQSTFMHEMGHVFLEGLFNRVMGGDGTTKEMNQWKEVSEWLKYDSENQTGLTVDQHEQFARGFEAYLMEGKAPSKGLESAFRSFRKWLVSWYKSVRNLDVELSDPIRKVFDSMLVTEQAINEAKAESGVLLTDIEQNLGEELADNVKEKLQSLKEQAEDLAFSRLFKDQMKLQGEEYEKMLAEKRKSATLRATLEVEQSEEGKAIRAQKETLKVKDLKAFAKKILSGKMSDEDLLKAEVQAEVLGFTSADHMAKELVEQKTMEQMIQEKVDAEIQAIESQKDPAAIKAEAIKKIRNEKSLELLAAEKEILFKMAEKENQKELDRLAVAMEKDDAKLLQDWLIAKEVRKTEIKFNEKLGKQKSQFDKELTRLQERAKEREQKLEQRSLIQKWIEAKDKQERNKIAKEFRESSARLQKALVSYSSDEASRIAEQAKDILYKKPYKEAASFTRYFTAERNAALRLAGAIKKGEWSAALQAKHEQMLNHALARESVRISRQVSKTEKMLKDMRKLRRDLWKHEDHWFQAGKILERFGYQRADFDPDFQGMSLSDYIAAYTDKGFSFNLPDFILDENVRIDPSAMSYEKLIDLKNALKNIRQVANAENTLFAIEDKANLDLIKQGLLTASVQNINDSKRFKPEIYETTKTKIALRMAKFFNSIKTVETLLAPLDNFKDKGKWAAVFVKSVYYAANDESKMIHELQGKLKELFSIYDKKELKKFKNEKIFVKQLNASLTKETLVSMALNLGNEANKEKLFASAGVGFDKNNWNEFSIMDALQEHLTEKDWKFVQGTWDLIDSYWGDIRKLHVEMTGFAPGKVKASPFTVMSGDKKIELKGGYYPLKQDARSSYEAEAREIADTPLYSEKNPAWQAATKTGHTKQRTEAKYPIKLELGVINEHLFNVIHDLAFRPTVTDLRRILTDRDIQKEMRSALGPNSYEMVTQYLASVAGRDPDTVAPGDSITAIVRSLRKSTTSYMLAINVKNILQNFSNVFIYAGSVEGFSQKDVTTAMIKSIPVQFSSILKGKNELQDFVFEKSSFMRDRSENPEFSLKELADKNFGENSALAGWSQKLMAYTDNATALPVWAEAYHKQIEEGASEKDAIEYADTIMRRSIGSGRRYDQASLYRSGELVKVFTMFSSFMNVQYNRWVRETNQALSQKDMLKYTAFAASQVIFVLSGLAFMGKLPGDEEKDKELWALRELGNYGMGLVPIVRDMGPLLMDRLVWEKPATYRASPVFEFFNTTAMAANVLASDKASTQDKVEAVVKVPMMATGTPMQFTAWFFNAADVANGMDPKVSDVLRRRPKKERH